LLGVRYADKDRALGGLGLSGGGGGGGGGHQLFQSLPIPLSLSTLPSAPAQSPLPSTLSNLSSMYRPQTSFQEGSSGKYALGPPGANLYVNNIPRYATENDVRLMFTECGTVLSVKLFPEGYGFVSYDNVQSANKAIAALNGLVMPDGKRLEVSVKKDKASSKPTAATEGVQSASQSSTSQRYMPY
jgi:CUG-BP- and ETR3-like factor